VRSAPLDATLAAMTIQDASLPATEVLRRPMRLLVTGGTGVLGRALLPLAVEAGHAVTAPRRGELDLFDIAAVRDAARDTDAVLHLATRIPDISELENPEAWRENDRLRTDATSILVAAALATTTSVFVQPSITFVYPEHGGRADEDTPIGDVHPTMASALVAERQALRFTSAERRGVVLRLGLLDAPGTGHDEPLPIFGATLHVADAARALLAALTLPAGIYNVCRDGERISNARFARAAGWRPQERS
jgi:nucleoside-diphosphate-sugar epimerase